ncbi:DUF6777 domain-containing protein [Streptomyces qinzhouensis]|uniref:DUF6777 domain-containing protein n=1 Tax=Streptomyces qinzhouensis TaxID=2599401 RepID=A0A5B8JK24_9ACTN|nr:DUF6777 domain-containing protein [Streptomyces qinzhouensis]QDY80241.1 hypothetical protein FQU76_31215 [Streptomyces qinzhouensis]
MSKRSERRRGAGRRRWPATVALPAAVCLGALAAGCGGSSGPAPERDEEVYLQPATEQGSDPYTATTARALATPVPEPVVPGTGGSGAPERGHTLRTMSGATPGLYGGTQSVGSCDVERQITLLRADGAKARAFAANAGISRKALPSFLRGLTPVVLRADTRVTGHGYQPGGGAVPARQTVLQAGTAVLVDDRGAPRVRCASGTPLSDPVAVKGGVIQKGAAWNGYRTDRVVVVKRAGRPLESLVIVDVTEDTWIDRRTGTDGEQDRRPEVLPPVNPDDIYAYPAHRDQGSRTEAEAPDGPAGTSPGTSESGTSESGTSESGAADSGAPDAPDADAELPDAELDPLDSAEPDSGDLPTEEEPRLEAEESLDGYGDDGWAETAGFPG